MSGAAPWLIVDGYNVIGEGDGMAAPGPEDLDLSRARLVERVAGYAAGRFRAVVVFDAAGNPHSSGRPRHVAGVAVVFTAHGEDADAVVERLAVRALDRGERAVVVTSDAQTQYTVSAAGAERMSSAGFLRELGECEASVRGRARARESGRATVAERVDDVTRERLSRWARGLP